MGKRHLLFDEIRIYILIIIRNYFKNSIQIGSVKKQNLGVNLGKRKQQSNLPRCCNIQQRNSQHILCFLNLVIFATNTKHGLRQRILLKVYCLFILLMETERLSYRIPFFCILRNIQFLLLNVQSISYYKDIQYIFYITNKRYISLSGEVNSVLLLKEYIVLFP